MNPEISTLGTYFFEIAQFWWLILPISLWPIFHILHIDYVAFYSANSYYNSLKWVILEIIPPREIERGPKIMETILEGISGVTTTHNNFPKYKQGIWWQDKFQLEIAGEEGKMHFYIRIYRQYKALVEAQVYSKYPDAEVFEVEDYTQKFPKIIPNKYWDLWGADFEFTNDIPIPIKTYDKFEESVTGEIIDPMASMAEVIATLPPGGHIWLQFAIEPLQEKWNLEEAQRKVLPKLKGEKEAPKIGIGGHLADVFKNIFKGFFGAPEFAAAQKKEEQPLEFRLSPLEKELLKATEDNLGRYTYKTKMRFIYLGRRENFNKAFVSAFVGSIKQFNDMNFNQLKPNDRSKTYGKIARIRQTADFRKRKIYNRYRNRNMDDVKIYLSSKELATIFHFPDMSVKSPAVPRTAARLGSAPANLPVESE